MKKSMCFVVLLCGLIFALTGQARLFLAAQPLVNFEQREPVSVYQNSAPGKTLNVAMISVLSRQETYPNQRQLLNAIGEKMGQNVRLLQRSSYAEIIQLLINGGADAALLSTGAYGVYGHRTSLVPLVMQQRLGSTSYQGLVIVPRDSKANSLRDLAGKSFAFVDPLSYSGHLSVIESLEKAGVDADTFFGLSYFTFSNDKSLRAVAGKFVDGAAINVLLYDYYKSRQPQWLEKIKVIATLPSAGTGLIVVRADYPDKEQLKNVLLHLHEDAAITPALDALLIDRFVETRQALYPALGTAIVKQAPCASSTN